MSTRPEPGTHPRPTTPKRRLYGFRQAVRTGPPHAWLEEYSRRVGDDPAPRTRLPLQTLAVAALAVQVHGWELGVRSRCLPPPLLGVPDARPDSGPAL
nr:Imm49 family immunity protein [Streptomyces lavendulae]